MARAAGVKQPKVSLALNQRLMVRTEDTDRLFEYLRDDLRPLDVEAPELAEAISRLTGDTVDGEARLARVLDAIAELPWPRR